MTSHCRECENVLTGPIGSRGPRRQYCNVRCRARASQRRQRADGRWAQHQEKDKARKRKPAVDLLCSYCGLPFASARVNRRHCGEDTCRKAWNAERQRELAAAKREQGIDIYAPYREVNHARYQEERKAGLRPSKRAVNPEGYRAGDQLRRARKAGVEAEVVQPTTVFERDGWLCGICFMPVDPELSWPDPGSASLDHIVPLSKGGPHTYANCRCAHLDCNVRRGAD